MGAMLRCFVLLFLTNSLQNGTDVYDSTSPLTFDGLTQVVYFQKNIVSGAKPQGDEGFASLKKINVNTIVCVDGVVPDVETAHANGIKTFHLPLKYGSPSQEQIFDLTTVVARALQRGVVYIHCHKGKHRSAAASAIVSISLGLLTVEEAKERMLVSETSSAYEGLWAAVERTEQVNFSEIQQNKKAYSSMVQPEGMIDSMISLDEALENLQRIQHAQWLPPEQHPDLAGAAEAGMIADMFRNIQLSKEVTSYSADFETQLVNAMHQANGLEEAFLQNLSTTELDVYMQRVEQSCIRCHSLFRK